MQPTSKKLERWQWLKGVIEVDLWDFIATPTPDKLRVLNETLDRYRREAEQGLIRCPSFPQHGLPK